MPGIAPSVARPSASAISPSKAGVLSRAIRVNPYTKILLTFVCVGLAVNMAGVCALAVGEIVWSDFLHVNPYRTQGNAVISAVLLGPLVGLFAAVAFTGLCLLTGAVFAVIGFALFGRIPLWFLLATSPVSMAALWGQMIYLDQYFSEYPGHLGSPSILALASVQLPSMAFCWFLTRRLRRPSAGEVA
jgi:hypothetical protein